MALVELGRTAVLVLCRDMLKHLNLETTPDAIPKIDADKYGRGDPAAHNASRYGTGVASHDLDGGRDRILA